MGINIVIEATSIVNTDTIQITPELLALIAEIEEFRGAWHALGTLALERLNALRRVATIKSIGSSTRIEGSKLSNRDVERLLGNLEIKITENHIRQFHRDLLSYSHKDEWHRGNYKTSSNSVATFDENGQQIGIVFGTATPFDKPRLMAELIDWLNEARDTGRLHPLLIIGVFVVVFLEIHPFQDGNGRLSRILTGVLWKSPQKCSF